MKKYVPVACVAIITSVVAAPAAAASHARPADAHVAKKCKKKHGKKKCRKAVPVASPSPPAPLPLTDSEVINRVTEKAHDYCSAAPECVDYGSYSTDPGGQFADCDSKSTYSWACYGYNDKTWGANVLACDFREIVERSGYSGITSHQDLTFGGAPWGAGWDCSFS